MVDKSDYAANTVAAKLYSLVGSPTEMVLANALYQALSKFFEHWHCWVYSNAEITKLKPEDIPFGRCVIGLVPQFAIDDVGRVDFAIFIPALAPLTPLVIAECDGHDFHEKTKEQASKDKRRDRALTKLGIPVLRFTGTDILRGCDEAVGEILEILNTRARHVEERWWWDIGNELNKDSEKTGGLYVPTQWPLSRTDGKK